MIVRLNHENSTINNHCYQAMENDFIIKIWRKHYRKEKAAEFILINFDFIESKRKKNGLIKAGKRKQTMPTLSASKTDILRAKTVQPGMYQAVIKAVNQKAAKTDGSINTIVTFQILGSTFDGVPVDFLISEKAPGYASELISILTGKQWDGEPVELDNAVGKKMKIKVVNDTYQGRLTNKIDGFAPMN